MMWTDEDHVCPPGGPCIRCAADYLLNAKADAETERDKLQRHIERLTKECAACCLQLADRCFIGTTEEALADLAKGRTDPGVLELVRKYQGYPLDTCRRCQRPAPCLEATGSCAWGCPP